METIPLDLLLPNEFKERVFELKKKLREANNKIEEQKILLGIFFNSLKFFQ